MGLTAEEIIASARQLSRGGQVDEWRSLMLVLLDKLEAGGVPADVTLSLRAAEAYWRSRGDLLALEAAKRDCWMFLKSFNTGEDLRSPDGRRVRALLCVLEPNGDAEAFSDTAEWFSQMFDER